jgi:uncharacterized tellurite resistance protein B-like protein
MHEQDKAILEGLVSVAWADGTFADREREMLEALLETFGANEAEANELREYAKTKRTLDDIPLPELSADDRRLLLSHAVILSWVDGDQHADEAGFLTQLIQKLNIPDPEAGEIMKAGTERAKRMLSLLEEG